MFTPLNNTIKGVIEMTFPFVFISIVILISLRITYLIKTKTKFVIHKELFMLFFIIYVLCLFQVVTFKDVQQGSSNFTLFSEILRYDFGSRLFIKNVLGNILLFIPYGYFVSYYLKIKKPYLIIFLILICSISIEGTQFYIGRIFDIDDILLNLIGGIIGYFIYLLLDLIYNKLPKFLKKDLILNILSIIILIGFIYYIVRM
ncbi:MAG: VanZ family protein [Bacilli bacterium]